MPTRRRAQRGHPWLAAALRRTTVVLWVAGWLLIASASPAAGHASLVGSSPEPGAQLDAPPAEIRLWFNERVSLAVDGMALRTGAGEVVETPPAEVDPQTPTAVVLPVPPGLPDDTYVVTFRVVSADSHPVAGALVFGVGAPAQDPSELDLATDDPAVAAGFTLVRGAGYAGLVLLIGPLLVLGCCWPGGWQRPRAWTVIHCGWWLSLLSAAAALLLQGPYLAGRGLSATTDPALLSATLGGEFGQFQLARIGLLAAAAGIALGLRRHGERIRPVAAVGLAVLFPATWLGTGHSRLGSPALLVADYLHLLAMTGWFGGLVLLGWCLLTPRHRPPAAELTPALGRFSWLATLSVLVLVPTGGYLAWQEVGSFAALAGTDYGRLLALKLAGVALLLCLGAGSRSLVQRAGRAGPAAKTPTRDAPAAAVRNPVSRSTRRRARAAAATTDRLHARLRRNVQREVVLATAVLALVAILVATPPGVSATAVATGATGDPVLISEPFGERDEALLQVLVDPARPGDNRVAISVRDAAGEAWDIPELRADFSLPGLDWGPVPVALRPVAPGEFEARATLPATGVWRLTVTVRTGEVESHRRQLEIPVGGDLGQ
ncbi:copper resistance protein CopC [Natronosporangium hydrolyticum]|uniref:Copper resistance protein CopC n=1 Tax=Natronosporangium hydrolyticum TaxID=2811111 RepID=A0A895YG15_9ACTN|nr:copper resistance protein CopC [Natronosporangium hydrolyticum]QSB16511.1 copper resistance protein CopC [Natronosporangium hydrolyticum]